MWATHLFFSDMSLMCSHPSLYSGVFSLVGHTVPFPLPLPCPCLQLSCTHVFVDRAQVKARVWEGWASLGTLVLWWIVPKRSAGVWVEVWVAGIPPMRSMSKVVHLPLRAMQKIDRTPGH